MALKRPLSVDSDPDTSDPDTCDIGKRQALELNPPKYFSNTMLTTQLHYNQNTSSANPLSVYGTPAVTVVDYDKDIDMEHVKDIEAQCSSHKSFTVSPSDTHAVIPASAVYFTHQSHEVCFGMICDVEAQFLNNPHIFDDSRLINERGDNQHHCQLWVIPRNTFFVLQSFAKSDVGVLNTAISHCLQELSGNTSIRYEALLDSNAWKEAIRTWRQTGNRGRFLTDINVYGPRDATEAVGKVFSKARLYFQHPYRCNGYNKYDNPHYLSFSNIAIPESPIVKSGRTLVYQTERPSKCKISEAFENLDQQEYVRQANIDSRVRTLLLSHQKEGADFIMQREAGIVPSALSLWKLNQKTSTRSFYEHLITGSKREVVPDSNLGGIISDEMGMGKSLTMLSAIVGSLATAHSFAQSGGRNLTSKSNQKLASKATLILVPSALVLDGWVEEIQTHIFPNTINIYKYHGPKRESDLLKLLDFDVILTTYATVAAEFRRCSNILHSINWFRIVLDEAHVIRHQSTGQFRAVSTLSSKIRWCLSGTPIQNSLADLGALVKFLRVPLLETAPAFRNYIISPIETGNACGFLRLRLLLKSLCLRRTNERLQLPEPIIHVCRLNLASAEDAAYTLIGDTYRQEIDKAVSGQKTVEAYNSILQALLRLRLLCNHGTYQHLSQTFGVALPSDTEEALMFLQQSDNACCAYCSCDITVIGKPNDPQSAEFTVCSHLICCECLPQYEADLKEARVGKKAQCPLCEKVIVGSFLASKEKRGPKKAPLWSVSPPPLASFDVNGGYSTKLSTLLQDIESQDQSDKSIVFSAWKKSLDLVACLFSIKAIPFAIVDGSLPLPERRKALSSFKSDPDIKVLNITIASRIHILEPQWNPAVERQAIGRILRLGQDKRITVIRYITNSTVEEYIESRQLRKLQIATVGWEERGDDENQKLKELSAKPLVKVVKSFIL
ncbi:P-loop containing nucleoside triphosphate hydrolase [Glarea lozoyensis ATCC 20868]|uniref:p-loop containing nucleoside triphosphate hydrolase n=1 Tax=Glarea lozoyensis (strain ATCC 20868 / MF5171) TaxID=1116229 RepID=S3CWG6_GLAL2|nr:P-loop containing nucleoside triphosphate hydrolase [Glarea lozoyensis ATCC 20868]EPE30717.1 P-loop containing nucleoside triphosphate hydrolase [Glarea lozoyensis ATCC 20868]